jgi:HEPN domain-containing protein
MSDPRDLVALVRSWVEKAEHDLINAEHTLKLEDDCPIDTVCFHAQQCVEKYLKALLVQHQREFPKTHDLSVLARLLPSDIIPKVDSDELQMLNRYPVEARYPGDWEPISLSEGKVAVGVAKKLRAVVRALLPHECLDEPHG